MSELFGKTNETPSMEGELLRALVGKTMDLWTLVKESIELVKMLAAQVEEIRAMKEEMAEQKKRSEELLQKVAEVAVVIKLAADKFDLPVERVNQLEGALERQAIMFEKPMDKTVRHHHFLGRSFVVLFVLVLVNSATAGMLVWQWGRAGRYADNEMRWRAVKLVTDPAVTKAVDQLDSSSQADPKGFASAVIAEEDRRADLEKNLLQEQEARQRIEELEKQKAKK
jgi:hypothetical protein